MKCIYCLQDKDKNLFDREHIIPKGLGTFGAHTPTLINKVCKACNGSLGKTIDNPLCRSGFAFDRHMKKVFKKTDDVSHHRHLPSTDLYIIEGKCKGHQVRSFIYKGDSPQWKNIYVLIERVPPSTLSSDHINFDHFIELSFNKNQTITATVVLFNHWEFQLVLSQYYTGIVGYKYSSTYRPSVQNE